MDTKEIIKFLKGTKYIPAHYTWMGEENKIIDEVIKRLQMWEDFKEKYKHNAFERLNDECVHEKDLVGNIMDSFEKEYFQVPHIYNVVEVDVLASSHDVIDELAKEIEEMNGRRFDKGKIRIVSTRIADYCLKKHAEVYLENINLKKKLKEYQEKPFFNVYVRGMYKNDGKEVIIQDMMDSKELAYYDTAFREGKAIIYNCKEMRIDTITISCP